MRGAEGGTLRGSSSTLGTRASGPDLTLSTPVLAEGGGAAGADAAGGLPSIIVAVAEICGRGGNCERRRGGALSDETGATAGSTAAGGATAGGAASEAGDGTIAGGGTDGCACDGGESAAAGLGGAVDGRGGAGRASSGARWTS